MWYYPDNDKQIKAVASKHFLCVVGDKIIFNIFPQFGDFHSSHFYTQLVMSEDKNLFGAG